MISTTSLEKKRARDRAYCARNRSKRRASSKANYSANRQKIRAIQKEYKASHRTERRLQENRRLQSDPEFRITKNLRGRVYKAVLVGTKFVSTLTLLGCTIPELRAHLESQFRPGMTWENYGPVWHIDHRRPCARFDLLDPAQQRVCFHYTNLQPLFAKENLTKGAR